MARLDRRTFLRGSGALSFLGGAGALGLMGAPSAWAADTTGYKALVCIFLFGGMDNFDTVMPTDAESWSAFENLRADFLSTYGAPENSSRARANLLAINPGNSDRFGGRSFGLPRELALLQGMFEAGEAAIVGNVGPLVEPATRSQFEAGSARLPERLFSHNDQQSTWMTLGTEGARLGWGGRFADAVINSSGSINPSFVAVSGTSSGTFLNGDIARPYTMPFGGPREIDYLRRRDYLGRSEGADEAREILRRYLAGTGRDPGNLYARDVLDGFRRAVELDDDIRNIRDQAVPLATQFPGSRLGRQLQTIAETINLRGALTLNRQVFFASTGGYDTHSGQAGRLPGLHGDLAGSLAAFSAALKEMGVFNEVTTFTASDFGRSLIINGDGSDHGWAGHHFVIGGAVRGRQLYGDVPLYEPEGEGYQGNRGRPIPSVSVDQYAATLGRWFGLSQGELAGIFPNLANFDTPDLGFMA